MLCLFWVGSSTHESMKEAFPAHPAPGGASFICMANQFVWSVKGFGRSRQDLENILPQTGDISSLVNQFV
jgi:hypothetical protein